MGNLTIERRAHHERHLIVLLILMITLKLIGALDDDVGESFYSRCSNTSGGLKLTNTSIVLGN